MEEKINLSADEFAHIVGLSVVLAKERLVAGSLYCTILRLRLCNASVWLPTRLLLAEQRGKLCRDDTVEGLRFYSNKFMTEAWWRDGVCHFMSHTRTKSLECHISFSGIPRMATLSLLLCFCTAAISALHLRIIYFPHQILMPVGQFLGRWYSEALNVSLWDWDLDIYLCGE